MNFWEKLPRPFTVLAPMEDVTDIVFRHVVAQAARPDVFYTEFTNATSFCHELGRRSTKGRLTFDAPEQPIVAQIWGTNPDHFRQMSIELAERGFAGVDINMGCPAKDVYKTGGGSGLIENPELAIELIAAAKEGGLPVSVKTRPGVRRLSEYQTWLPVLLEQNLANLTIHLRTRKEMSRAPAHYELIPEIVRLRDKLAPQTRLTINGDIRNYSHIVELHKQYPEVDGFMIGRGVFANPYCFDHSGHQPTQAELVELFRYHLDEYDKWRHIDDGIDRKFDPLKHFFKIYIKDFDGAKDIRTELYNCKTTDQVREVLNAGFPVDH